MGRRHPPPTPRVRLQVIVMIIIITIVQGWIIQEYHFRRLACRGSRSFSMVILFCMNFSWVCLETLLARYGLRVDWGPSEKNLKTIGYLGFSGNFQVKFPYSDKYTHIFGKSDMIQCILSSFYMKVSPKTWSCGKSWN
jgi:hypothetical protein